MKLNTNRTLLIEGKPIICGGGGDGSGTVNANPDCYIFDQSSWKFLVNLGTRRSEASSVVLWDELWVKNFFGFLIRLVICTLITLMY